MKNCLTLLILCLATSLFGNTTDSFPWTNNTTNSVTFALAYSQTPWTHYPAAFNYVYNEPPMTNGVFTVSDGFTNTYWFVSLNGGQFVYLPPVAGYSVGNWSWGVIVGMPSTPMPVHRFFPVWANVRTTNGVVRKIVTFQRYQR